MGKNTKKGQQTYPDRLFDLPDLDPVRKRSRILDELQSMSANPRVALNYAARVCIRECQPAYVEVRLKKLAEGLFGAINESERSASDLSSLACLSYDSSLFVDAYDALDKQRICLEESGEPSRNEVRDLYSSAVLLSQASPTVSRMEFIAKVALLQANVLNGGIVNAYQVLWNLSIELHSDDGAIVHARFYESLFNTFRSVGADYPWLEPDPTNVLSPIDFANLVRSTVKGRVISNAKSLLANQPQQLEIEF